MSIEKRIIEISSGRGNERIISPSHTCGYCKGNGFFRNDFMIEIPRIPCPVCKGGGKLDAIITIDWQPAHNEQDKE